MKPFLDGQVALITGASNGLGRSTALLLALAGASVVLVARNQKSLDAVATDIEAEGGECLAVAADLTSNADVAKAVIACIENYGQLDFLINCGGSISGIGKHLWDISPEEWDTSVATNATGVLNLIRHVAPIMIEQRSGRMHFVSSAATLIPTAKTGCYASPKSVVNHMVQTLIAEAGSFGLTANVFNPGPIDTASYQTVTEAIDLSEQGGQTSAPQSPDAAARLLLWLCSPETEGVTGEFINWNHPNTLEALGEFLKAYQIGVPVLTASG